jgi:diguanylate cyclase (GGDEF)-like protein
MNPAHSNRREEQLSSLSAAFDVIPSGVVVLDADLKAEFVNSTFFSLWDLSRDEVPEGTSFEDLMRIVAHKRSPPLTEAELSEYVKYRTDLVRKGIEAPRSVRLDNGKTLRIACKELPDGGRALVYTDVSDLMSHAEKLHELATVDDLTGLYNRRHFLSLVENESNRFERYRRPTSLVMIDVDEFKAVNDQFGHAIGDHVLRELARLILASKRKADIAARVGGDEFLILLPETSEQNAFVVADRFRQRVGSHVFSAEARLRVTVSIGIAEASDALLPLIKRADEALYRAKRGGRNQVQGQA